MEIDQEKKATSSFEINISQGKTFAEIIFHGAVTLEILNQSFLDLLNHPHFVQNINACNNFCDAVIETDMQNIEKHAQFVSQYLAKRGFSYQLALVSDETLNNAFLSIYKLLISKTEVYAEVFSSPKQALLWLEQ